MNRRMRDTFAEWGIDYLKYDWCSAGEIYHTQKEMQAAYQKMGEALCGPRAVPLCSAFASTACSTSRPGEGRLAPTFGEPPTI